jgi:hypothetical protein
MGLFESQRFYENLDIEKLTLKKWLMSVWQSNYEKGEGRGKPEKGYRLRHRQAAFGRRGLLTASRSRRLLCRRFCTKRLAEKPTKKLLVWLGFELMVARIPRKK